MKTRLVLLILCSGMCSSPSWAQSSVTLYGIISTGIGYVNNEGGKSAVQMFSGANQNNRWGLKIREDLGGGLAALAQLENGFSSTNGTLGQGGRMFGRQAFVGLGSNRYGTMTFGRQYDMMWDYLDRYEPQAFGPGFGTTLGDSDNVEGNFRYNNSVKYVSPNFGGLTFEGLYAFSNKAGDFSQNRAWSAGVGYDNGSVRLAAAYLSIDQPGTANANGAVTDDYAGAPFALFHTSPLDSKVGVRHQEVAAVGGLYRMGAFSVASMYSNVHFSYLDNTGVNLNNFDVIGVYQLTPAWVVSAAWLYTSGHYQGVSADPHWNQAQASVDYYLSKRTDVFAFANYVRASNGPLAPAVIFQATPSSTRSQLLLLTGIRHLF
ncbi:porin [Paraburkholderia caballeronis]|uniref:Outer membrane protein (Porin) n=1 Tax=Paraburkholderia caballeronis TaxID=416943 RepID=A0A1H7LZT3_9BURK|nr:porin [Paraburkholderia caballeronis]PXW28651.1 putative porin [Paraburkholderia caballeronis]PXX04017.1 putative porin [Paraburkholderia caballeronis]RAK04761.1 putative porin [Paraburkholderia caballeronis]TDV19662.1 putative porin [Paraburkholderia caballeronis]TDV22261.1 putative porin [Paraburkholderia caballeronis]